jgi:hypothetical protein
LFGYRLSCCCVRSWNYSHMACIWTIIAFWSVLEFGKVLVGRDLGRTWNWGLIWRWRVDVAWPYWMCIGCVEEMEELLVIGHIPPFFIDSRQETVADTSYNEANQSANSVSFLYNRGLCGSSCGSHNSMSSQRQNEGRHVDIESCDSGKKKKRLCGGHTTRRITEYFGLA